MWGDVASCTCWTTLCICIWVFVFLFVFLYLCISILHLCIFICPFVFSYSANQPVRRCSAWWTTLSNAAMNHDYTLWCAGAVCILHHHLTVSRSYFAILSRTYLITIIHTHTRKISGDQNSNFIFEQHKKQIYLGLSLGCGSAAHWSTIHRAFILWVFETDLVYGWVEQMICRVHIYMNAHLYDHEPAFREGSGKTMRWD